MKMTTRLPALSIALLVLSTALLPGSALAFKIKKDPFPIDYEDVLYCNGGREGAAFKSAIPVVYGKRAMFGCDDIDTWLKLAAATGLGLADAINSGFNYVQAVKLLRHELALPEHASRRQMVVDAAINEVYGRSPTPEEASTWEAQAAANKAWYAAIVSAEIKNLNNDKAKRRVVLDKAYMTAFGRKSTAVDQDYWLSRPEHFRMLIDAQRSWLYSPEGAEDLKQTIIRSHALRHRGVKARPLGAGDLSTAIAKYTPQKAIFSEMKWD